MKTSQLLQIGHVIYIHQIKDDVFLKIDEDLATLNIFIFDYTPKIRQLCSSASTLAKQQTNKKTCGRSESGGTIPNGFRG